MKVTVIIVVLVFSFFSQATIFPMNFDKNTEVLVIDNPVDDEVIRLEILGRAKKSIDVIAHTQTTGEFGLKVINTLRQRMAQGVKMRYLYEKIASMGVGETSDRGIKLLTDERLYVPTDSKLIVSRPIEKFLSPFTITDLLHEKIIIVDRGTPNEIILVGGRNHDEFSVTSSDFTFVLRRVDSSKPYLGDSLQAHFNVLYDIANKYFSVEKPRVLSAKENQKLIVDVAALTNKTPSVFAESVLEVINAPAKHTETPKEFQFFPAKTRLITNDLLETIAKNKLPKNYFVRKDLLKDDITSYFSGLVENSSKLELTSYILSMPELIKDSIRGMLADGGKFVSYSNDGLAYGRKLPLRSLGDTVHSINIETFFDFTSASEKARVKMFNLDPNKGMEQESPVDYNHRKVAVLDVKSVWGTNPNLQVKPRRIVFTGSYNFTLSSASKNDEMAIMFDSTEMGNYISKINKRDASAYYIKIDPTVAKEIQRKNKIALKMCRRFFESLF